jgi:hypothetical protein
VSKSVAYRQVAAPNRPTAFAARAAVALNIVELSCIVMSAMSDVAGFSRANNLTPVKLVGIYSRPAPPPGVPADSNKGNGLVSPQLSRLAVLNLRILVVEDRHHEIVMPDAIDKRRPALPSLDF